MPELSPSLSPALSRSMSPEVSAGRVRAPGSKTDFCQWQTDGNAPMSRAVTRRHAGCHAAGQVPICPAGNLSPSVVVRRVRRVRRTDAVSRSDGPVRPSVGRGGYGGRTDEPRRDERHPPRSRIRTDAGSASSATETPRGTRKAIGARRARAGGWRVRSAATPRSGSSPVRLTVERRANLLVYGQRSDHIRSDHAAIRRSGARKCWIRREKVGAA